MPQLDFSSQAEPVAAASPAALDFSGNAEPVDEVSPLAMLGRKFVAGGGKLINTLDSVTSAMDPAGAIDRALLAQAAQRQGVPVGAALDAANPLRPLARNAIDYGALGPNEVSSGKLADFAGGVGEAVPQLAAAIATGGESALPEMLPSGVASVPVLGKLLTAITRGAPTAATLTAEQSTNLPDGMTPLQQVEATAKAAGINTLLAGVPGAVGSSPIVRTGTGAALGYGTSAAQSALEGQPQDQTQNLVGAFIGAALGGAHPSERVPAMDPHLADYAASAPEAAQPREPLALPGGADYSAKAEPVRPVAPDVGGPVRVSPSGEAVTLQQGASAFSQAVQAGMAPQPARLPAPVVAVDRAGNAATNADTNAAQAAQQQAIADRQALGITPDIERSQGVRWSQREQQVREETARRYRLGELDNAIATREAQGKPARGINAKPDESMDDALTFLAKSGGLDRRTFVKEGVDPAVARSPQNRTRGGASRPLFRAQDGGGLSLDDATRVLWQHGYIAEHDNHAALDLIMEGVNQDKASHSIHRQDQGDLLALEQARRDTADHQVPDYTDVPFSRKPTDARFSFAGERAQTADRGALTQAQQMEAMGRDSVPDRYGNQPGSPEDTHIATGWHRGVDGKWRFEIDDSKAIVDADGLRIDRQRGAASKLGDVFHHPALMAAYPELAGTQVRINPEMKGLGAYNAGSNRIDIRPPSEYQPSGDGSLKSVLLHEIQHAIQNHEGFARGGNATEARTLPEFEQTLRQHMDAHEGEMPPWESVKPDHPAAVKAARAVYQRLAGEVEARNTQRRMKLDATERRATPPSETADTPRSQQIVRFNGGDAHDAGEPHADQQAIDKYAAKLSSYIGKAIDIAPAAHVPDATRRALSAFDAAFGSRSIVVRNGSPDALDFNGVTLRDGVRLINEDATSPVLTVAGHEMIHQLRADAPELYAELADEVRRQGRLESYAAVLNARARASGEGRDVHPDLIAEELAADAAGDALSDPDFIEQLAQRNPGLFRRLATKLMDFLARVSRQLRSLGSSPFLADVDAYRAKLADVLERYASRQHGEGDGAPEAALSRKHVADQTDTPAFAKWFGDSKVVDAEGKPLVVYHGTNGDFSVFDKAKRGSVSDTSDSREAFFFTSSPSRAAQAVRDAAYPDNGRVMDVYLRMHDPLVVRGEQGMPSETAKIIRKAKKAGHDGVIFESGEMGGKDYAIFEPEQIKSATGNRGTFDADNPSILFSRKPVDTEHMEDMPSRRPGESQNAYLRRITRKNGEDIKAATSLAKNQRKLGRYALRGMMATQARQMAIADAAMNEARKTFDKTPDVINYASVHEWETGQRIVDPDFRHFVDTMQTGFDQRIAEIQRMAPGALESLIENYMPHLYEDSGKAAKWYQNALGKRPLAGDKSFLKQREWPTLKEAMASGLKPISPNPVDWVLMKYAQMDKFIGLLKLKEDFQRRGWLMKLEPGQRAPEGFAAVDDPSFRIAGGLQGQFVVPELIAKDINNYLTPGLSKYGAWRTLRGMQNAVVSWNLGWSAFHAGFTSVDNAVTHGAVGLQRLADGDIAGGLMALVKAVPTMITSPFEGAKLNKQWTGQAQTDPHTAALLDLLEQGGARMKMGNASAEYNNALPQVMRTIRRLQAPGAIPDALERLQRQVATKGARGVAEAGWGSLKGAGRALSAVGEVGSFLIHHVLVPNQKMAARVTLLKFELDRYAKQLGKQRGDYAGIIDVMHPDVAKQLASDVVDKVDFRLGQMTYDNFFYPKILREISQALVMAPGWQAGAYQTMTGGLKDLGRFAKPEKLVAPLDKAGTIHDAHRGRFTNNVANLAMLFLMVGGGNALYQWLVSGIKPDSMKDLVGPRTGRKNADDSDERIVPPSYMKDHYEFFHHPVDMASHKLHPMLRMLWEISHNEDYFGNMIRDPHHGLGKQALELAGYLGKSMLPFTATNAAKVNANGGGLAQHAANFVGITPAAASLARTEFQAFVAKGGQRGWDYPAATPAEAEYQDRMRKADNALRTGQTPDLTGLTEHDVAKLKKRTQTPKPELQFDRLSLEDKLDAYELATPEERQRYRLTEVLRGTRPQRSVTFRRLPAAEQRAILTRLEGVARGH